MLSKRIRQLRQCNGIRRQQLAEFLCISASTIGMYEQGRRIPSVDTLIAMAKFFRVSLDYLLTGHEYVPSGSASEPKLPQDCPCSTCYWKACKE